MKLGMMGTKTGGEVFGEIKLTVSLPVESTNNKLALMEAEMRLNDLNVAIQDFLFRTLSGNVELLKHHDTKIDWQEYINM